MLGRGPRPDAVFPVVDDGQVVEIARATHQHAAAFGVLDQAVLHARRRAVDAEAAAVVVRIRPAGKPAAAHHGRTVHVDIGALLFVGRHRAAVDERVGHRSGAVHAHVAAVVGGDAAVDGAGLDPAGILVDVAADIGASAAVDGAAAHRSLVEVDVAAALRGPPAKDLAVQHQGVVAADVEITAFHVTTGVLDAAIPNDAIDERATVHLDRAAFIGLLRRLADDRQIRDDRPGRAHTQRTVVARRLNDDRIACLSVADEIGLEIEAPLLIRRVGAGLHVDSVADRPPPEVKGLVNRLNGRLRRAAVIVIIAFARYIVVCRLRRACHQPGHENTQRLRHFHLQTSLISLPPAISHRNA